MQDFVLRVGFRAWYDEELYEFAAETVFLHPEQPGLGPQYKLGRRDKQAIGFLYLRALRTGRRAATLDRGSLLDVLLREQQARPQLWEHVLQSLRQAGGELEADTDLSRALEAIQHSIDSLTPLSTSADPASSLQIGRLTRRHLRQTMTYFLASRDSNQPVPFDRLGNGTSNVLVFALLGAIAAVKENVIFAMEEPEIALPPHTQRVVIRRLWEVAHQAIVTSHSPYVAEQFLPAGLVAVRRAEDGAMSATTPAADAYIKEKAVRRDFRTRFAEGLLARTIVLVEGVTELWAFPAIVDVLSSVENTAFNGFDLDGVVLVPSDGTGELPKLAGYFGSVGIPVITVCDQLTEDDDREAIEGRSVRVLEHEYVSFESLMAREMSVDVIRRLARACTGWGDYPHHLTLPAEDDQELDWRRHFQKLLKMRKGDGYAARLLSECEAEEMPASAIGILRGIREVLGSDALDDEDPLADLLN